MAHNNTATLDRACPIPTGTRSAGAALAGSLRRHRPRPPPSNHPVLQDPHLAPRPLAWHLRLEYRLHDAIPTRPT